MKYENELRTKDGHVLQQSWTVRAVHGRGLPGRFDQDLYVALLQMIDQKGLPGDGWLSFSLYELVELMGRKHSGRDYMQVRESLQRLATTSIESNNAFYHRGRKEYISDTFSLLLEVKLSEYEDPSGERADRNRVLLSQYFVDSYKANYLKNIDARLYWSLSSPIAKRLYRLIDKKRNGRRIWEAEIFSLKDRIPLSDYRYASKIKEKLAPAHAELIAKDFLEEVSYRKSEDGEFASYKISESFQSRRSLAVLEHPTADEFFSVQRLKAEGMGEQTARELVSRHGTARVMQYVEAVAFQKNLRNPAGWLRKAIENGYELDMPPALPSSPPPHGAENRNAEVIDAEEPAEEPATPPMPDPAAQELWTAVLDDLNDEIDATNLHVWFEGTVPSALNDSILTLAVPNDLAEEYIERRFKASIEASLRGRLSPTASLHLVAVR